MPTLHDSPEGQTHSYGDGCGCEKHNPWWMKYCRQTSSGRYFIPTDRVDDLIAEAERQKTEEIRAKILDFQNTMKVTSSKVSSEYRDGVKVAISVFLGKL